METIQSRLVHARKRSGLSQAAVAERAGMSQPTYSQLERGLSRSSAKLVEIARVLGVDPGWLATGKGSPELRADEGNTTGLSIRGRPATESLDPLQASLLAAAAELEPLQVADLIAYARQLSGGSAPPARAAKREPDYLDTPIVANMPDDEMDERRRHDYGPPGGVERRAKN